MRAVLCAAVVVERWAGAFVVPPPVGRPRAVAPPRRDLLIEGPRERRATAGSLDDEYYDDFEEEDDDDDDDDYDAAYDSLDEAWEPWDEGLRDAPPGLISAILVGFCTRQLRNGSLPVDESLEELDELVTSTGLSVVDRLVLPGSLEIDGTPVVDELKGRLLDRVLRTSDREFAVVFDDELTPPQQRKLEWALQLADHDALFPRDRRPNKKLIAMERQTGMLQSALRTRGDKRNDVRVRVVDRSFVVMELFAKRARRLGDQPCEVCS